ncbi:DUF5693 family protein [Tenuibacillus multivorans]|uniref:Uncharacterized protein n=1 Tax=Tenuibacillus multivorans TaxID=237069 RepID=A0A1G9X6C9_9BACI|nr:DUF5693 family protein [Tenuibacillus multivorans]GEL78655.1 hypothetical protein TMU01_28900 [Tenuibacillus multivorans]SDM92324.1 hypothetical protein SAMN05216498_1034 [Tenuibacillus multivorans]
MSKRILLLGIVILLLLASLPGVVNRWQVEESNATYETVLPYFEIEELTSESGISLDEALQELKDAGLTTISVEPISLDSMDEDEIIDLYSPTDLKEALRFSEYDFEITEDTDGVFVSLPENEFYMDLIFQHFEMEEVMVGSEPLLHLKMDSQMSLNTVLGYDQQMIEKIKSYGFNYIARVENTDQYGNETTIDYLTNLDGQLNGLLFSGEEAIGYPDLDVMTELTNELHDAGYYFYDIEFTRQKGNVMISRNTGYDFVRLHSLTLDNTSLEEDVDQAIRAVKERNMRSLFLHVPDAEPHESLQGTTEFLDMLYAEMPDKFTTGSPAPFEDVDIPFWSVLAAFAAGVVFIYIASEIVPVMILRFGVTGLMALLAIAYLLTDRLLFAQAFALGIAVAAPSYAVVKASQNHAGSVPNMLKGFLMATLYTFVGILIVVAVLNGNGFITGFEMFRGVKLVYLLPIAFVAVYFFWQIGLRMLNTEAKYWHLVVIGLLGAVGLYYLMRTGNTNEVSQIEMTMRQLLEEYLYVRPRTKEFLLGFPAFVLGLYVMRYSKIWGRLLLIPGVIGFLSIMNTFTHFHIPLEISLLRTVYGLVFGLIIGLIAIVVFNFVYNYARKFFPRGE